MSDNRTYTCDGFNGAIVIRHPVQSYDRNPVSHEQLIVAQHDEIVRLKWQRDGLLTALKDVIQWADDRAESDTFHGDPFDPHTRDFIEAAIAACKEKNDD